jgi:hypothetical protein
MTAPTGRTGRTGYDPFAPAAATFPEQRLRRAGVDDDTVDRLRVEFGAMSGDQRRQMARFVTRNTNRRIAATYQGRRSRSDLEAMTVDEGLIPLLRERGLPTHGRKAELIDRLIASYDAAASPVNGALTGDRVPDQPDTQADTPQAPSGDDAAQTTPPTETPAAAPAPDTAAPADTTTTEEEADRG